MTREVTWYKTTEEMRQALRGATSNAPYQPKVAKATPKKRSTKKVTTND